MIQLVELEAHRSTMPYQGIVGHDLGHAYGDRAELVRRRLSELGAKRENAAFRLEWRMGQHGSTSETRVGNFFAFSLGAGLAGWCGSRRGSRFESGA